jgi:hypothetical protein
MSVLHAASLPPVNSGQTPLLSRRSMRRRVEVRAAVRDLPPTLAAAVGRRGSRPLNRRRCARVRGAVNPATRARLPRAVGPSRSARGTGRRALSRHHRGGRRGRSPISLDPLSVERPSGSPGGRRNSARQVSTDERGPGQDAQRRLAAWRSTAPFRRLRRLDRGAPPAHEVRLQNGDCATEIFQ